MVFFQRIFGIFFCNFLCHFYHICCTVFNYKFGIRVSCLGFGINFFIFPEGFVVMYQLVKMSSLFLWVCFCVYIFSHGFTLLLSGAWMRYIMSWQNVLFLLQQLNHTSILSELWCLNLKYSDF